MSTRIHQSSKRYEHGGPTRCYCWQVGTQTFHLNSFIIGPEPDVRKYMFTGDFLPACLSALPGVRRPFLAQNLPERGLEYMIYQYKLGGTRSEANVSCNELNKRGQRSYPRLYRERYMRVCQNSAKIIKDRQVMIAWR